MKSPAIRRATLSVAGWLACLATVALAQQSGAPPSKSAPPPTFRSSVDLIAVDVQVVDRDGHPVLGLTPDKFQVTVGGKRRTVVSAQFVRTDSAATPPAAAAGAHAAAPVSAMPPPPASPEGQLFVLAIDAASFGAAESRGVALDAGRFLDRLPSANRVALFTYPNGPKVDPTTDRAAIHHAIETVVGQKESSSVLSSSKLRPSEFVDVSNCGADPLHCSADAEAILTAVCGPLDPKTNVGGDCRAELIIEANISALQLEAVATQSIESLSHLMIQLKDVPGRKVVVLLSAGLIVNDRPGGHPDVGDLPVLVGQQAAESNATIYTLFIETGSGGGVTLSERTAPATVANLARDTNMTEHWLDEFSSKAGGALMKLIGGNPDLAFNRIVTETSGYYLLGVQPVDADRDGAPHELSIKVLPRGVTVRGRSWMAIPRPGAVVAATVAPAAKPVVAAPVIAAAPLNPIELTYDRGDYAAARSSLGEMKDLTKWIRDFRTATKPWADAPQRAAVFSLELAAAAVASGDNAAEAEAARLLLVESAVIPTKAASADFICAWYWAGLTLLEGGRQGGPAGLLGTRAAARCATHPRVLLAVGVLADQRSPVILTATQGVIPPSPAAIKEVTSAYEAAAKFPETALEARTREAWFRYRMRQFDAAAGLLTEFTTETGRNSSAWRMASSDTRYCADLILGHIFRAKDQADRAIAAYRAAIEISPSAHSARLSLMTLLLTTSGHGDEAEALAEDIQHQDDATSDPWRSFPFGDYRAYPTLIAKIHEVVQ